MKLDPRHAVAITAATEHFTAIFAHWMLANAFMLEGADPRMKTLWLWHCAEETEHRNTAFDVYKAMDGNEKWRLFWFRYVTGQFMLDILRQTLRNLWDDKALLQGRTWASALQVLLGREGLVRRCFKPWRAYFSPAFHPSKQDASLSLQWLHENAAKFRVLDRSAA